MNQPNAWLGWISFMDRGQTATKLLPSKNKSYQVASNTAQGSNQKQNWCAYSYKFPMHITLKNRYPAFIKIHNSVCSYRTVWTVNRTCLLSLQQYLVHGAAELPSTLTLLILRQAYDLCSINFNNSFTYRSYLSGFRTGIKKHRPVPFSNLSVF